MLQKMSGSPYSAITALPPIRLARTPRTPAIATMPMSLFSTFLGQLAGHSFVANGLNGTKWLDVPYLGPPVAPQSR